MNTRNYNVNGFKNVNQILSNSEIKNLNKENKLNWKSGHQLIFDNNRVYFFKENEQGKVLFMHITGRRNSTFLVAKFKPTN